MDFSKDNTTSVRVRQTPGGNSNFSLAWDAEPSKPCGVVKPAVKPLAPQNQVGTSVPAGKTSTKVSVPPGGRSNIVFG